MGVNRDHGLGHGHPTDLSIVIAHTGEDGRQYLPGLDRERRTGRARWEGWHVVHGMWPQSEHGCSGSNLAEEPGIFHWMSYRARSQWLARLIFCDRVTPACWT